jgi:hypothetical protein
MRTSVAPTGRTTGSAIRRAHALLTKPRCPLVSSTSYQLGIDDRSGRDSPLGLLDPLGSSAKARSRHFLGLWDRQPAELLADKSLPTGTLGDAAQVPHLGCEVGLEVTRPREVSSRRFSARLHHGRGAMNILLAYARACYALVLAISTGAALFLLYSLLAPILTFDPHSHFSFVGLVIVAVSIAFLLFVWRIARESFRRGALLSKPASVPQWIGLTFLILLASLGHYCGWIVLQTIYEILYTGREAPSPLGLVLVVLALCYLIALWIGEFVLTRDLPRQSTELATSDQ